jgi:hypothetical protein
MRAASILWSVLIIWQGCDVRSSTQEQVRQKMEGALQPYFPRVKVALDRDQQRLSAFTCVSNVGEAAVRMVPSILDKDEGFRQLKRFHSALRFSTFEMVFDRYLLTLDLERNKYDTVPIEQVNGAAEREKQACGQ